MIETKITKAIVNERDELVCNFLCKKEDYTIQEWQLLKDAKLNGNLLDLNFTGLKEGDQNDERKSKLNKLHMYMTTYSEKFGYKLDDLITSLYTKYGIKTRKELDDSDLDEEIESFKASIMNGVA